MTLPYTLLLAALLLPLSDTAGQQPPVPPRPAPGRTIPSTPIAPRSPNELWEVPRHFDKSLFERSLHLDAPMHFDMPKFEVPMEFDVPKRFDLPGWDAPDKFTMLPGRDALPPRGPAFHQGDPADSLYRAAHNLFSRQEYRPAADRFADLRGKFPGTRYFCDAAYYESFARYRLGTPTDLRTANRVLDSMSTHCVTAVKGYSATAGGNQDVPQLTARIDAALARLGDSDANERVRRAASQGQKVCDSEERNVRIAALSALAQMDPQSAAPVLRSVLATKDACSAPIRRQAISMIARRNDAEAVGLLAQVARNDADRETQMEAVRTLSRMSNDAAYAALEEYLRTSTDEQIQVAAAGAMASSENPRAQAAVRSLIERKDVAERIRVSAINSLGARANFTADYWKGLYGKVESDELRKAVVYAIARITTDEAQQFLLGLARNTGEPYAAREAAISRIRTTAPVNDLYKLLETADSRSMRMSIVSGLSARKEAEATDRLIDIAKAGTDPEVRAAAIRALGQAPRKNDPKVVKALEDILRGGDL